MPPDFHNLILHKASAETRGDVKSLLLQVWHAPEKAHRPESGSCGYTSEKPLNKYYAANTMERSWKAVEMRLESEGRISTKVRKPLNHNGVN